MTALLLKVAPWLLGALALFSAGTWSGYHLNPWHGRYTALQATDAQDRAAAEAAVRRTLQAQLVRAQETTGNNANTLTRLTHENAALVADRDHTDVLVRRLLAGQARPAAPDRAVSEALSGQFPARARGTSGDANLAKLLGDAHDECVRNADRLDALIAEISPQLR